jgi:hypothetical protein
MIVLFDTWGFAYLLTHSLTATNKQTHSFLLSISITRMCICVLVTDLIRLKSIRLTTFFLLGILIYDTFITIFTFTRYYQSDDNSMIRIPGESSQYLTTQYLEKCEKYPDDPSCMGMTNLVPMVLSIPRINDYRGELSILHFGDMIIPALLIGFCARLDASKRLIKTLSTRRRAARRGITTNVDIFFENYHIRRSKKRRIFSGYFIWISISYMVGLFLSFMSNSLLNILQPALLYVSPLILITLICLGKRRGELYSIWEHHETIEIANRGK